MSLLWHYELPKTAEKASVNAFKFRQTVYLKVLPAASTGQVLHDEPILCADGRAIFVSARPAPAAITTTTFRHSQEKHS